MIVSNRIPQTPPERPSGPDLVVDDVQATPAFPMPNDVVYFDVTVRNQGDKDAAAFNVRVTSDGLDDQERVSAGLKAGAKTTLRHLGPLMVGPFQQFYWVDATADSDNEVAETREDNNTTTISVIANPPPQPPPIPPIPVPPPHVLLAE